MEGVSRLSNEVVVEVHDFPVFLAARRVQFGGVEGLAKHLGVSQKLVYYLLAGKRKPSNAILKKLGGRYVIAIGDIPKK